MKVKKGFVCVLTIFFVALLFLFGCGKSDGKELQLKEGILSWSEDKKAIEYEVNFGDGAKSTKKPQYDLTSESSFEGTFEIVVSARYDDGKIKKIGSKKVELGNLEQPIIGISDIGDKPAFVWKEVEGAKACSYDAYDGKGLQRARNDEDGMYVVPITNTTKQMIRVVAHGNSKDDRVLCTSENTYTYTGGRMFDVSLLANCGAVYTADSHGNGELVIGTTMKAGVYDMQISFYLMDKEGYRVTGNGGWGRRIVDANNTHFWFVDYELEGRDNMAEVVGHIPNPDEVFTATMRVTVDRSGNAILSLFNFGEGEKIVVSALSIDGKSVLNANNGKPNEEKERTIKPFDITKKDSYIATFTAPGTWAKTPLDSDFAIRIPAEVPDGNYNIAVSYYMCAADGYQIEGNGLWARRLSYGDEEGIHSIYYNETEVGGINMGVELPLPTTETTSIFNVNVKDGYFNIYANNWELGEMVIISKVKVGKNYNENGVFVSQGKGTEKFKIQTNLIPKEDEGRYANLNLKITYTVQDIFGKSLSGNGGWGRRMTQDGINIVWMCEDDIPGHPKAKASLTKVGVSKTVDCFVWEINKKGVLSFDMFNYRPGEMVKISSITYIDSETGKEVEILKK